MPKKVATTVYITEEQQNLLRELNQRSRVPIAEFIRQGIDMVLHSYKEMLPGQMVLPFGQSSKGSEQSLNAERGQPESENLK